MTYALKVQVQIESIVQFWQRIWWQKTDCTFQQSYLPPAINNKAPRMNWNPPRINSNPPGITSDHLEVKATTSNQQQVSKNY